MVIHWRQAVRQFYLKVHPDIVRKYGERISMANENSVKQLESLMRDKTTSKVKIEFHIPGNGVGASEKIEKVIRSTFHPPFDDDLYNKKLDRFIYDIVKHHVPEHVLPKQFVQPAKQTATITQESEKVSKKREQERMEEIQNERLWEHEEPITVRQSIEKIIATDRIRCSSEIKARDALSLVVQSIFGLSTSERHALLSPSMEDITFVVVSAPNDQCILHGRIFYMSNALHPDTGTRKISELIRFFREFSKKKSIAQVDMRKFF